MSWASNCLAFEWNFLKVPLHPISNYTYPQLYLSPIIPIPNYTYPQLYLSPIIPFPNYTFPQLYLSPIIPFPNYTYPQLYLSPIIPIPNYTYPQLYLSPIIPLTHYSPVSHICDTRFLTIDNRRLKKMKIGFFGPISCGPMLTVYPTSFTTKYIL